VSRLWKVYPGICLTAEEKARKTSVAGECQLAKNIRICTQYLPFFTPISYKVIKIIKIIVKINLEVWLEVLTTMTVKIFFGDVRDIPTPTFQRDLLLP
jgi:hypothetical protein